MEFLRIVSYKTLMSPLPLFCTLFSSGIAQMINNLAAMRETWVGSLGQEDPLKKEMATHSSILAWRIPRTEEPGGLQSIGSQRVGHDYMTNTHRHSYELFFLWNPHSGT